MILGSICARLWLPVRFPGKTQNWSVDEPRPPGQKRQALGLQHVVITSVTRDDLADGGANTLSMCLAVRELTGAVVEVLTPDFIFRKDHVIGPPERTLAAVVRG